MNMKQAVKNLSFLALAAGLAGPALGDVSEESQNPYQVIVARNPFGLRPPPPPPPPVTNAPPASKVDIFLTGMSTLLGPKRAYFMTEEGKGKTKYYALGEDERSDGVEVLEIDGANKTVRVKNQGVETLMSFSTHGIKTVAPPMPMAPGTPGLPGTTPPPGGANALLNNISPPPPPGSAPTASPANVGGAVRSIPSRTIRTAQPVSDASAGGNFSFDGSGRNHTVQHPAAPQQGLSAEEQILMLELQRAAQPNQPLPPTPGL